jgi:hypothetical protein
LLIIPTEYIIKPFLSHIYDLILNYREKELETVNMRKNTFAENEIYYYHLTNTLKLELALGKNTLIVAILKELTPYLRFLESEIEDMETYNEIEKMHKELEDIIKETNSLSSDSDEETESINDNYIKKIKKRII